MLWVRIGGMLLPELLINLTVSILICKKNIKLKWFCTLFVKICYNSKSVANIDATQANQRQRRRISTPEPCTIIKCLMMEDIWQDDECK